MIPLMGVQGPRGNILGIMEPQFVIYGGRRDLKYVEKAVIGLYDFLTAEGRSAIREAYLLEFDGNVKAARRHLGYSRDAILKCIREKSIDTELHAGRNVGPKARKKSYWLMKNVLGMPLRQQLKQDTLIKQ